MCLKVLCNDATVSKKELYSSHEKGYNKLGDVNETRLFT
jgi:hypothetical protein